MKRSSLCDPKGFEVWSFRVTDARAARRIGWVMSVAENDPRRERRLRIPVTHSVTLEVPDHPPDLSSPEAVTGASRPSASEPRVESGKPSTPASSAWLAMLANR